VKGGPKTGRRQFFGGKTRIKESLVAVTSKTSKNEWYLVLRGPVKNRQAVVEVVNLKMFKLFYELWLYKSESVL
jgi:hypothetical protein